MSHCYGLPAPGLQRECMSSGVIQAWVEMSKPALEPPCLPAPGHSARERGESQLYCDDDMGVRGRAGSPCD